jgi:hypothetical protein
MYQCKKLGKFENYIGFIYFLLLIKIHESKDCI